MNQCHNDKKDTGNGGDELLLCKMHNFTVQQQGEEHREDKSDWVEAFNSIDDHAVEIDCDFDDISIITDAFQATEGGEEESLSTYDDGDFSGCHLPTAIDSHDFVCAELHSTENVHDEIFAINEKHLIEGLPFGGSQNISFCDSSFKKKGCSIDCGSCIQEAIGRTNGNDSSLETRGHLSNLDQTTRLLQKAVDISTLDDCDYDGQSSCRPREDSSSMKRDVSDTSLTKAFRKLNECMARTAKTRDMIQRAGLASTHFNSLVSSKHKSGSRDNLVKATDRRESATSLSSRGSSSSQLSRSGVAPRRVRNASFPSSPLPKNVRVSMSRRKNLLRGLRFVQLRQQSQAYLF